MATRYFVKYLEGRRDLQTQSGPTLVVHHTFDAGLLLSRNCGYTRKKDALRHVEQINAAAGKEIAQYAGAYPA